MERVPHNPPPVTIAIPTYNRAATYLPECLGGALRQTYSNLEIIVADNGSTDRTSDLVAQCGDPRVRYFRHPRNIAPNDNYNFCLGQARGAYFQLLQDDEQIDPDFVESCLRAVGYSTAFGLIHTGVRTVDARGTAIGDCFNRAGVTSLDELFLDWFAGRTALYLCSTLFHREALLEAGGFASRHNLFQDVVAQVKVAARMPRAEIAAIKATTRQHGGQFTYGANVRRWCEDSLELLDLMCRLTPDRQALVRRRGSRFFATIGYSRASMIRNPFERLRAYFLVHRLFDRRYLPPARLVLSSTGAYRRLRQAKRRLLRRPAWVD
jgi:glycosyltransferase involved in cell wall biosynthesis